MKKSKEVNTTQIIGSALICIGIFVLFIENDVWYHDYLQLILAIGLLLFSHPTMIKLFKKLMNKVVVVTLLGVLISSSLGAQDYEKQLKAFKQSFDEKSVNPLEPHLSSELKFDPIPIANTPVILKNIVTNLPQLNSIVILESSPGKAEVEYNFVGLGVRKSAIHFDEEGKITRIKLIENLIQQEIEAQQKMKASIQEPPMTELAKTYKSKEVEFKADDGLAISGNLYEVNSDAPVILLCHQAGYNGLEYRDIAPRLNELGYNCLAIDQRSGGDFAGQPNKTLARAKAIGVEPVMADAKADVKAAIGYLFEKYGKEIIVWGSSYSASLALLEGLTDSKVKAVVAFSPGDYFGKALPSLKTVFATAKKPFWITSSREEAQRLTTMLEGVDLSQSQKQFIPTTSEGFHGSRALWTGQKGADEYWKSLLAFLQQIKSK